MARVTLTSTLSQYTGGVRELDVEAHDIRALMRELGERFPPLAPHLDDGLAVAIDGEIFQDTWFEPIPPGAEVSLLPKIGGG
jgi:sulfur-carrier protein